MQEFLSSSMHSGRISTEIFSSERMVAIQFVVSDGLLRDRAGDNAFSLAMGCYSAGVIAASGALQIEWLVVVLLYSGGAGQPDQPFHLPKLLPTPVEQPVEALRPNTERTLICFMKTRRQSLSWGLPAHCLHFCALCCRIGRMEFRAFQYYNMLGVLAWVFSHSWRVSFERIALCSKILG